MTIDTKDMLNSILSSISQIDYIKPEDIPNIDLYMDQVTTFMEKNLSATKRYDEEQNSNKNYDQQLCKEQSSSAACEEEIFERTCSCHDLYLLFQKYFIY